MISLIHQCLRPTIANKSLLNRHVFCGVIRKVPRRYVRPISLQFAVLLTGFLTACGAKGPSVSQSNVDKSPRTSLSSALGVDQKTLAKVVDKLGNETIASYEGEFAAALNSFNFQNFEFILNPDERAMLQTEFSKAPVEADRHRLTNEVWKSISFSPSELSLEELEQAQHELGDWLSLYFPQKKPATRGTAVFLMDPNDKQEKAPQSPSTLRKITDTVVSGWELFQLHRKINRLANEPDPTKSIQQLAKIALSPKTYQTLAKNAEKIELASELADKFAPTSELAADLKAARRINYFVVGPSYQALKIIEKMAQIIGEPRESSFAGESLDAY